MVEFEQSYLVKERNDTHKTFYQNTIHYKERENASLYIYHFSTVIDFSSEKYSGSTGHRNCWYQQRNLNEDAGGICWYQKFLCPVKPLYFLDEKSTTVEK